MLDLETLLAQIVQLNASDLYLKSDAVPMARVHGELTPLGTAVTGTQELQTLIGQMTDTTRLQLLTDTRELNMAFTARSGERFRVNAYYQRGTLGLVMRRVNLQIPTIEDLQLPLSLKDISLTRQGLFLVCGPTGSGKSTTLAAMLDYRNANARDHIITIEDPIEYLFQDKQSIVSQREVGLDTLAFENALKNALRQAPDVISIGEVRDLETAATALTMSETGHLVFATVHASNTYQSLERMVSIFTADKEKQLLMILSMNLRGLLAQRLIPRADGRGRMVATELLIINPLVKELIRENKIDKIVDVLRAGELQGSYTFDQNIFQLLEAGLITPENAIAFADNPGELQMRMKGFKGSLKQV